jgi:hypothetical protein
MSSTSTTAGVERQISIGLTQHGSDERPGSAVVSQRFSSNRLFERNNRDTAMFVHIGTGPVGDHAGPTWGWSR